jgi:hypothetical protein
MHFIYVLYYNYFLFYKKIIKDPEPHFATVLALSFSQSLLLNGILDIAALKWFCYEIAVWVQFSILILIVVINYFILHRTGKIHEILKNKPGIGNSRLLSNYITILFFLVTTSWLFWGPIYGKYLLGLCK